MTPFTFEAATAEGRLVSGEIEAGSPAAARSELRRRGLFPVDVRTEEAPARSPWSGVRALRQRLAQRPSALEITRELAALLAAGLTLDRSITMLGEVFHDAATAALLEDLRARLRRGASWSESLAAHPEMFDESYVRVIEAGEEAGRLDAVVASLAAYLERRAALRERIQSSLVYPVLMAIVGGAAVLVLLVFVFPRFVGILEETGAGLPLTTVILLTLGEVTGRFWWLIAALAAGGLWGLDRWRRTAAGNRRLARIDLAAPVWGGLRRDAMAARFAHTLALLLRNGVRVLPGLRTASRAVGNVEVAERLERALSQMREGQPLSAALESQRVPFPDLAVRMIAVGEESGALPDMLEKVATLFDQRVERRAERIVALLEPALIVAFGVGVGFVAVAMMQAVLRIQQAPL